MKRHPEDFHAWDPGLKSRLPDDVICHASLFATHASATTWQEACELKSICGLSEYTLAAFTSRRLIEHEVLVRVMAELTVQTGRVYADHGINFRQMARDILSHLPSDVTVAVDERLKRLRADAEAYVLKLLADRDAASLQAVQTKSPPTSLMMRLRKVFDFSKALDDRPDEIDLDPLVNSDPALASACETALEQVTAGITAQMGLMIRDHALITRITTLLVGNRLGTEIVHEMLGEAFEHAVDDLSLRRLPLHRAPFVVNSKGASGAGKSSLRPHIKSLSGKIGVPWEDFAVVSPDIWRKFLINYEALGDDIRRYAAPLSGHELTIVDQKLDTHFARMAGEGHLPHLLIDRFRFDSFLPPDQRDQHSRLLSRFGQEVYLFFVITPPEATVERAWNRGLEFGRFKAVDDLLHHNVEAYVGMPELFLTWAHTETKQIFYEFLDNSVAKGETPQTIARGCNGSLHIYDIVLMKQIVRNQRINISARRLEDVHVSSEGPDDLAFIQQCLRQLTQVFLYVPGEIAPALASRDGKWMLVDENILARAPDILKQDLVQIRQMLPAEACDGKDAQPVPDAETNWSGVGTWPV